MHVIMPEKALITHIMDGKEGTDSCKVRNIFVEHTQEKRHQACLPVVAMEHIRKPAGNLNRFQDAFGEEYEALGIIEIIPVRRAVEVIPVKILVFLDQIDRNTIVFTFNNLPRNGPLRYRAGEGKAFVGESGTPSPLWFCTWA